jgi:hypothetical protein
MLNDLMQDFKILSNKNNNFGNTNMGADYDMMMDEF